VRYGSGASLSSILAARAAAASGEKADALADLTADELREEAAKRDLPTSGTKAELIARLTGDDA